MDPKSKYIDLHQELAEYVNNLPEEYYTDYEVGYNGPFDIDDHVNQYKDSLIETLKENGIDKPLTMYGVYEEGTNHVVCQTGINESMSQVINLLLNNMDLISSALHTVGMLDTYYDLKVESEA